MKPLPPPLLLTLLLAASPALSQQGYGQPDYSQQSGYPPAAASPYPEAPAASPYPQVPAASPYPQAPAASPYPDPSAAGSGNPYPTVPGTPQGGLSGQVSPSAPGYPSSALQGQQPGGGISPTPGWTPPQAVQPVAAVAGGPCGVKLSTDRSTIYLTDPASGVERKQLSLGSDRVQRIFTSPDKAWGVAIYKVRGVAQFGVIALDLTTCEEQMPVELPALATAASFEQGEVILKLEKGPAQRVPLQNARIQ